MLKSQATTIKCILWSFLIVNDDIGEFLGSSSLIPKYTGDNNYSRLYFSCKDKLTPVKTLKSKAAIMKCILCSFLIVTNDIGAVLGSSLLLS